MCVLRSEAAEREEDTMTRLLTVDDVAERLQLSRSTVYEMKKKIGYLKVGGAVRFREEDITNFLDGCQPGERHRLPPSIKLKCASPRRFSD